MKRIFITIITYLAMIIYIISTSIVLCINFGEPSEGVMDSINTISVYLIFTPVVLYLLVVLFLVLNGDLAREDKYKCHCKCCYKCCKEKEW